MAQCTERETLITFTDAHAHGCFVELFLMVRVASQLIYILPSVIIGCI